MHLDPTSNIPIFNQIATSIEDSILTGIYPEESRVPSTTEISAAYRINPATVLKGVTLLVDEGILYKQRGIGMFVCPGAAQKIRESRKELFYQSYITTLVAEAKKLGLSKQAVTQMLGKGFADE